jgi:hypothetical protein
MHLRPTLLPLVPFVLTACFEDPLPNTQGDGGTEVGDGDGDPTGDGDGDGDGEPGDGDGEPGDGDGEPGDGDGEPGDGDGDPAACADGPYAVSYTGPIMLNVGPNSQGVTIGDVDNDGDLDVIATSRDAFRIATFLNAGDGSFMDLLITDLGQGTMPEVVLSGAIADGVLDVVFRAYTTEYVLVRMRGDGSGGFYDFEPFKPESTNSFALGHATGDLALDILIPATQKLIVYQGSVGQESFWPVVTIESPAPFNSAGPITVADLDDDGDLDVATTLFGSLFVGLGNGAGEFSFGTPLPFVGGPSDIATGDVDGDGKVDIVLTTLGGGSDAGHVFHGLGNGVFGSDVVISAPSGPSGVAVADIDLDGIDDVAAVGSNGTIAAYLSTGDGFGPAKQVNCMGTNARQLWIGDLNGDCVGDVVTVTSDGGVCIMMSEAP